MATRPQLPLSRFRAWLPSLAVTLFLVLTGCSRSGGGTTGNLAPGALAPVTLVELEYGQLVDVYGLRSQADGDPVMELYRRDVLIGRDIEDERPEDSLLTDEEITYDFLPVDPDTLQPRLFITRDVVGSEFADAFDALDDKVRRIAPHLQGTGNPSSPYSVVPRNAAIRLTFSGPIGVDDSFFVERAPWGGVTLVRNVEAVQLLDMAGGTGSVMPMPIRIVVGERDLIVDPVLMGTEGNQYVTTNNAAGMPASPDSFHANMRLALAVEGPFAIPALRAGSVGFAGETSNARSAVVSDFRSGNEQDESVDIVRGFLRDSSPLRIVGEIPMYLERVDDIDSLTQEVTVFKNGLAHDIDRGDVLRFLDGASMQLGRGEILEDPVDDRYSPTVQHVRVRIRRIAELEGADPSNLPGYPSELAAREAWLVANAPHAVVLAEFRAGGYGGDDPSNFVAFTPTPLEVDGYVPRATEYVSPFAGAVVRFTKPVDMATVKAADTMFFATRDLCDQDAIAEFISDRPFVANGQNWNGMKPEAFDEAKYRTPHLVAARVYDEDGSQTSLRLQPMVGFYLDGTMRNAPSGVDYSYYLHLISDSADGGIRDLAGRRLDLQDAPSAADNVVIPFTVDTRSSNGQPVFEDNLAVSVIRRFVARDEDENPSYYLPSEVQGYNQLPVAASSELPDIFGASVYADGRLHARPTTRSRVVADDLNQPEAPQHPSFGAQEPLAWCPPMVGTERQYGPNSAYALNVVGETNPLNPYGCRLQTVWREVDLGLSRDDPFDFNLDIEQMYWAPEVGSGVVFDEFDRVSMWLGHSELRPAPCVGSFSSLPSLPDSGLARTFDGNFAWNPDPGGNGMTAETWAPRRVAYEDAAMVIDPAQVVFEPNGVHRYLPLPEFQKPYFVFRDETVMEQGGRSSVTGSDLDGDEHVPYILSPFAMGQGRRRVDVAGVPGNVRVVSSYWNDMRNRILDVPAAYDNFTGGLVGSVAMPLLADFWTYCDSSELPAGGGYVALGVNGWQAAFVYGSYPFSQNPAFTVLSGGRPPTPLMPPICRSPGDPQWTIASGGFAPSGAGTPSSSRAFYWMMMDVLKRQTVLTSGFVDLYNPHRVPEGFADARLGPFFLANGTVNVPPNVLPSMSYATEPALEQLPDGTSFQPLFRGASAVDPSPFYWQAWMSSQTPLFGEEYDASMRAQLQPTDRNFPLDPYKAGDAHLRKWDTRPVAGSSQARNWWTHLYNRTVTSYVEDPGELMDPLFTNEFSGPNETFTPSDVRYVNWRFIASNNTAAFPPAVPSIDTFTLTYRWQQQ